MRTFKSLIIILMSSLLLIGCNVFQSNEEKALDLLKDVKNELEKEVYFIKVVDSGQHYEFFSYGEDNFIVVGYNVDEVGIKATCDFGNNYELYMATDIDEVTYTDEEAVYWCEDSVSFIGGIYDESVDALAYGIENLTEEHYISELNGAYNYSIEIEEDNEVITYSIYKKGGKIDISFRVDDSRVTIEIGEKTAPE